MLWFILVAATILFAQSYLYSKLAFSRVTYTREFDRKAAYIGDEVQLIETITNRKLLPMPWINLESSIDSQLQFQARDNLKISGGEKFQYHKSFFSLLPYMKIRRKHRIKCQKRGCYRLDSATIITGDPLGLHKSSRRIKLDAQLLVYPEVLDVKELPDPSRWMGEITVERWMVEDPFMISGAREYRYGDPLHQIHWKATARMGQMFVHNRDYTADQKMMLLINFDINETMWTKVTDPERIELAIQYAATYATQLVRSGGAVGFGCNGTDIDAENESVYVAPGRGTGHLLQIYETMARLLIKRSERFHVFLQQEVWRQPKQTDYLIFTSFINDTIAKRIEELKKMGNQVEIVWLTDESKGGLHHESDEAFKANL